jgi:hypothetical protein
MRAQNGGKIVLTDKSVIERDDSSELKWYGGSVMNVAGNSTIINGDDFLYCDSINVFDRDSLKFIQSTAAVPSESVMNLGMKSNITVEGGSNLAFTDGFNVNILDSVGIRIADNAAINVIGTNFNYIG